MLVFGNISEKELIGATSESKIMGVSGFPIAATLLKIAFWFFLGRIP